MTVRINFLPKNYQPPKQLGAKEWGAIAAAAVTMAATGLYYSSVYSAAGALEQRVISDRQQLQVIKAKLAQAQEIKAREDRVQAAEAELQALTGRDWSGVLIKLRELTPQHVTWTNLKAENDGIVLKALSRGLVDVAQLFGGLVDDPEVDQVALKYLDEKGVPITAVITDKETAQEVVKEIGIYRQLEFEMTITLVKAEGGKPYGA